MVYKSYPEYLKSPHWTHLRSKILARDQYKCLICTDDAQQVHHINYRNWIDVHDDDLMSVCEGCHCSIHVAIDRGYVPASNKSSLTLTLAGLKDMKDGKQLTHRQTKSKSRFTLDKAFCEELDKLPPFARQLLCGIFKRPMPKTFMIYEGKTVGKATWDKIIKAKNWRPKVHPLSEKKKRREIDKAKQLQKLYGPILAEIESMNQRIKEGYIMSPTEVDVYRRNKRILTESRLLPSKGN